MRGIGGTRFESLLHPQRHLLIGVRSCPPRGGDVVQALQGVFAKASAPFGDGGIGHIELFTNSRITQTIGGEEDNLGASGQCMRQATRTREIPITINRDLHSKSVTDAG